MKDIVHFITTQYHEHQQLLITLGIGAACGLFSQMIMPGRGFGLFPTVLIGIAGCFIGNALIKEHLTMIDHNALKTLAAGTLGAMALSLPINLIRGGKDKDKTGWRNNT